MRYLMGATQIELARRELLRAGTIVDVEPKVFDLIVYLAENADRVVPKDQLIEAIWDGRAIADTTLSSCVKAARRALDDNGRDQRMIRTIHGHGFRFVGPLRIEAVEPRNTADVSSDDARFGKTGDQNHDVDLSLPGQPSVAVLPFATLDKEGGEQQLLAGGLLHDLTVRLARTRWLFVSAWASAEQFRIENRDPVEIGRLLGVRYLLHGSIVRSANRLRLTIALTDARDGGKVWAEWFDRGIDDLFAVQDEVCEQVIAGVEFEIELRERRKAVLRPMASLDAWSAYHRGMDLLYRYSTDGHQQAELYFNHAVELDPGSSRIFAGLSFLNWQRAFLNPSDDRAADIDRALDYAHGSVSLDPFEPLGHWALGRASLLTGDIDTAIDELGASTDLNPSFANGHYSLGYGQVLDDKNLEAVASAAVAQRISPYDPMTINFMLLYAEAHALLGDAESAIKWARRAARQPNAHFHGFAIIAWCCELSGVRDLALDYVAELRRRRPDYSRAEYFRTFPFKEPARAKIDGALRRLGI